MELLIVCTPQHTGSHFLLFLLESHRNISHFVHEYVKVDNEPIGILIRRFCKRQLSLSTFVDKILSAQSLTEEIITTRVVIKQILGLDLTKQLNSLKYKLVHIHAGTWGLKKDIPFKTIITIRDPILSILTALKRFSPIEDIISGLEYGARISDCFRVCIDLQNNKEQLFKLFDYLGLSEDNNVVDYINLYPVVGETTLEVARSRSNDSWIELVEESKQKLFNEKIITPILYKWIYRLRESKLEEYYKNLGYSNLIWFSNVNLKYE